jgi:hypothetical protein
MKRPTKSQHAYHAWCFSWLLDPMRCGPSVMARLQCQSSRPSRWCVRPSEGRRYQPGAKRFWWNDGWEWSTIITFSHSRLSTFKLTRGLASTCESLWVKGSLEMPATDPGWPLLVVLFCNWVYQDRSTLTRIYAFQLLRVLQPVYMYVYIYIYIHESYSKETLNKSKYLTNHSPENSAMWVCLKICNPRL